MLFEFQETSTFQGGENYPDLHGEILAPSSDWWVCVHPDRTVALDVRFIIRTMMGL
jgi:hypothetical protein